ncbi:hypothetical protein HD806DRAFT_539912 [Xylariaceae sp. AK1471]|nr:hypothetical protein HD806DRAFT_539912 [Xylariaceae sp. AK1471]
MGRRRGFLLEKLSRLRKHVETAPIDNNVFQLPKDHTKPSVHIEDNAHDAVRYGVNVVRVSEAITGPRIVIYTDGSHLKKGFSGSAYSYRRFFPGALQGWTNVTFGVLGTKSAGAEFLAVHRALLVAFHEATLLKKESWAASNTRKAWLRIIILTDSQEVLCTIRDYLDGFLLTGACGFSLSTTMALLKVIDQFKALDVHPEFHYVPAHCGIVGNENADKAASRGSLMLKTMNQRLTGGLEYEVFTEREMRAPYEAALNRLKEHESHEKKRKRPTDDDPEQNESLKSKRKRPSEEDRSNGTPDMPPPSMKKTKSQRNRTGRAKHMAKERRKMNQLGQDPQQDVSTDERSEAQDKATRGTSEPEQGWRNRCIIL